jgi:NADPH-dependent curcumin reductase CurA
MQYTAIRLVKRPEPLITPDIFAVATLETPTLSEGEMIIRQTHMSLDPAMKGWMSADRGSYIPPVELGAVMRSSGFGEVVESRNAEFPVGTRVMGMFGWAEYAVSDGTRLSKVPPGVPAEAALCVLALPGVTAWQGLMVLAEPKAGETLLVSGAAGSVGSIAGQLGKIAGMRVIGSAGSQDKRDWLVDELGFDAALDYRSKTLKEDLAAAAPKGLDIYFENTGGPIQAAAYQRMNAHGRIVVCGMIADYNSTSPPPGPNWLNIIRKRLTIRGFTMPDHWDEMPAMSRKIGEHLLAGRIRYRAHVLHGLESAIEGINLLFTGGNTGKLMVQL